MATPEGQSAYRRRSPLVEGRIAHLQGLGLRRFLRRGRSGALFEWLIGAIALNVKILSHHWEVVSGVIGEAQMAPARV